MYVHKTSCRYQSSCDCLCLCFVYSLRQMRKIGQCSADSVSMGTDSPLAMYNVQLLQGAKLYFTYMPKYRVCSSAGALITSFSQMKNSLYMVIFLLPVFWSAVIKSVKSIFEPLGLFKSKLTPGTPREVHLAALNIATVPGWVILCPSPWHSLS